jgi:hypothetical protein
MTLNPAIPAEVGCAEAVSKILELAGVTGIPTTGIPGTATLFEWLNTNPNFERLSEPQAGAILVSATGSGNGTVSGHTGIVGIFGYYYPNDWGIVSNDSQTGLLLELWDWKRWQQYYVKQGGLETAFFLAK